eukprot:TRINITY_DN3182_c0_g1_i1.p1 TRINITY_DN3182_c0_g1~~TRINITY_DN3182_c0_g1_i1.p1  ORF type:complete len:438 (+),score=174.52 TRINITY_DN3182_c0_g1_i1:23-1315(+)
MDLFLRDLESGEETYIALPEEATEYGTLVSLICDALPYNRADLKVHLESDDVQDPRSGAVPHDSEPLQEVLPDLHEGAVLLVCQSSESLASRMEYAPVVTPETLPAWAFSDMAVADALARRDPHVFYHLLDERVREDSKVSLSAVKSCHHGRLSSIAHAVPENLRKDPEFMLESVRFCGDSALTHLADPCLKGSAVVAEAAILGQRGPLSFDVEWFDKGVLEDIDVVRALLMKAPIRPLPPRFASDKGFILSVVPQMPYVLKRCDEGVQRDKEFLMEVLKVHGLAFGYLLPSMKDDPELAAAAVRSNKRVKGQMVYHKTTSVLKRYHEECLLRQEGERQARMLREEEERVQQEQDRQQRQQDQEKQQQLEQQQEQQHQQEQLQQQQDQEKQQQPDDASDSVLRGAVLGGLVVMLLWVAFLCVSPAMQRLD